MSSVEIVKVEDPSLLEEVFRVRLEAWRPRGFMPSGSVVNGGLQDESEAGWHHWLARQNGQIVGGARLAIHSDPSPVAQHLGVSAETIAAPGPVAWLTRLAVAPSAQRQGIAKQLDATRLAFAQTAGCKSALVEVASAERHASLLKRGFRTAWTGRDLFQRWTAHPNHHEPVAAEVALLVLHLQAENG